jgi:hypothetical protein
MQVVPTFRPTVKLPTVKPVALYFRLNFLSLLRFYW